MNRPLKLCPRWRNQEAFGDQTRNNFQKPPLTGAELTGANTSDEMQLMKMMDGREEVANFSVRQIY